MKPSWRLWTWIGVAWYGIAAAHGHVGNEGLSALSLVAGCMCLFTALSIKQMNNQ
jgi:hypothetical protein